MTRALLLIVALAIPGCGDSGPKTIGCVVPRGTSAPNYCDCGYSAQPDSAYAATATCGQDILPGNSECCMDNGYPDVTPGKDTSFCTCDYNLSCLSGTVKVKSCMPLQM